LESAAETYESAARALDTYTEALAAARHCAARAASLWEDADVQARAARAADASAGSPFAFTTAEPAGELRFTAVGLLERAREQADEAERVAVRQLERASPPSSSSVFSTDPPGTIAFGAFLREVPFPTLLTELAECDPEALRKRSKDQAHLLQSMLALGPETIAVWWQSLTPAQASAVATSLPRVVGNLDGVPPRVRSDINHRMLVSDLAAAEKNLARQRSRLAAVGDGETQEFVTASQAVAAAETYAQALRAIMRAYGDGPEGEPPHELYAYHPGANTKVALSTGLLEQASQVTLLVPGMGTTAADIGAYAGAAGRLRTLQASLSGRPEDEITVLSWLDYDAPGSVDVNGVLTDDRANVGAGRLASSLRGLRAAVPDSDVSVVAHSYGTDVASLALIRERTSADHLVLLGSAGIPKSVGGAAAMNVPAGEVFASQAEHDGWAPIGQSLSGRVDPTSAGFGAHVFSSEDWTLNGVALSGVTRHGPFGDSSAGEVSYLDGLSTPLTVTAMISTGRGRQVPEGGTPVDRMGAGR
jgi:hypothetical protein